MSPEGTPRHGLNWGQRGAGAQSDDIQRAWVLVVEDTHRPRPKTRSQLYHLLLQALNIPWFVA